jgi:hypothetical protein
MMQAETHLLGFGSSDMSTSSNNLDVGDNFNSTMGNLCGDTKGLEARGLSGLHFGVAGRDDHILGHKGTSTGGVILLATMISDVWGRRRSKWRTP